MSIYLASDTNLCHLIESEAKQNTEQTMNTKAEANYLDEIERLEKIILDNGVGFRCLECGHVFDATGEELCEDCREHKDRMDDLEAREEEEHRAEMWAHGHQGHFFSTSK